MKKSPNPKIMQEIALHMNISPSFVEKDWYVVQAISLILELNDDSHKFIFAGGTSLSKAYQLIKRFSEDIDFRVFSKKIPTRATRRDLKEKLKSKLANSPYFEIIEEQSFDESTLFQLHLSYPLILDMIPTLRPHIKVEVKFSSPLLETEQKEIQSFYNFFNEEGTEAAADCISPLETAVDKVSALIWRIDIKDRNKKVGTKENDPTIIRHLHDLAALKKFITDNADFSRYLAQTYDNDRGRGDSTNEKTVAEMAILTLAKLKSDKEYEREYLSFVDSMSYASDIDRITFLIAVGAFEEIVKKINK